MYIHMRKLWISICICLYTCVLYTYLLYIDMYMYIIFKNLFDKNWAKKGLEQQLFGVIN